MARKTIKPATVAAFTDPVEEDWPENPTEMDCFGW